jgi:hypothetical protein
MPSVFFMSVIAFYIPAVIYLHLRLSYYESFIFLFSPFSNIFPSAEEIIVFSAFAPSIFKHVHRRTAWGVHGVDDGRRPPDLPAGHL